MQAYIVDRESPISILTITQSCISSRNSSGDWEIASTRPWTWRALSIEGRPCIGFLRGYNTAILPHISSPFQTWLGNSKNMQYIPLQPATIMKPYCTFLYISTNLSKGHNLWGLKRVSHIYCLSTCTNYEILERSLNTFTPYKAILVMCYHEKKFVFQGGGVKVYWNGCNLCRLKRARFICV